MKIIISISAFLFLIFNAPAQQADYQQLKSEAERAYVQSSYSRANEIYSRVDKKSLAPAEARWVEFRLADTEWRAQAGTTTSDNTKLELAESKLAELIRTNEKEEDRDLVWAEAHESLADFYWTRRGQMNWGAAWPHYQQALDWWAGQREIEPARQRYLKVVFKAASPPNQDQYYYYSYYGNYIPLPILENALKISTTENDKARLHFMIAMTMRNSGGDWESRQRVGDEFEEALKVRQSEWYDDALFNYAEWMNSNGTIVQLPNGQWQQEVDYVKALELYRRLVSEFKKGETRYYDQAQQQIRNITEPSLGVGVSNIFLPDSETQFGLNARNLKRVDLALYKVDLTRDARFTATSEEDEGETDSGDNSWIQRIPTGTLPSIKTWSKTLDVKGDHKPVSEQIRIDAKLPVGAYLIEARSGSLAARDLVLITDASLVLKSSAKQALAYFSHALTGAPIANASVALWESYYSNNKWHWRRYRQTTNNDGLAMFTLKDVTNSRNLFAAASIISGTSARQAFVNAYANGYGGAGDAWRIYAFTDRPAYRPKETVQWKFIARRFGNGVYTTPANQVVEYQITDPRGAKVSEGKATLNDFGSAWGSVDLTEQLPLGEYNIQFWDAGRANGIGNAKLFRLEEYKLPEFKVAVKTPEQDGKKKAFRLGEQVEVDIQADYYFGGPVSNASVEVVVYQNPFYHYWHPYRDYGWFYDDIERQRRPYYYGPGQVVKRETIKTDASGKARLSFDTPRENYNQDFEYRIEARVTDSSRREIVSSDTVRVTRQRYYVYPRPQRNIYRPGDKVTIDIKALDANEQPVTTEGTVRVTRDYWWEVWIDPTGREVKGEELRLLRARGEAFPPVSKTGKRWRLKFRGYEHDEILTQLVKTDAEGKAQVSFTPQRDGYYRLAWESSQKGTARRDRFLPPVKAETAVFVASNRSTELGYRYSGVQIIVDKETVRAGETAPVMLFVSESLAQGANADRYVLFSVEGEDLYSYRLVRITGTAKLIELPIEEKHVPNIYLSAAMVSDAQLHVDTKQIVVPPVDRFLSIDVKADREQYQPREEGTLTVTAKDADGRPVSAEIALGLVDESVKYIQQDYAGDPRQFYYGTKRSQMVQTQSTFNQKSYIRLFDNGKGQLTDSATRDEGEEDSDRKDDNNFARGRFGNVGGADQSVVTVTASEATLMDSVSARRIQELPTNGRAAKSMGFLMPGVAAPPPPVPGQEPAVQVRSDFRSTIFWQPEVRTDADGTAVVKVKYPDSLTTWSATARAASSGNQFGIGNTSTRTKQPLIVRLQSPRFFVVGDQVTISAVINNNTEEAMTVDSALQAEGVTVSGLVVDGKAVKGELGPVQVKAGSEARVDWWVTARQAGEAKLKVEARAAKYADAMEKTFIVYEHGIEKFVSRSGKMRADSVTIGLDIPKARRAETTELSVQVAPSMATTMLDALPYLIDYPYGCTEQTMSRFLPAAITAKTLRDLGLKPETAMQKIFGGIEESSAAATHPTGKRDLKELNAITRQGLDRLYNFQHGDGGWGWWKDGESDHFMTAYVLWGMTLARQSGIEIKPEVAARAAAFLDKELVEEEANHDAQAWMLHALAVYHDAGNAGKPSASGRSSSTVSAFQAKAFDNIWANRDKLNAYTRALLALAAHNFGYADRAKTLLANLENGVKIDTKPDTSIVQRGGQASDASVIATAHWGEDGVSWRWSEGGVEATAFALRAFLAIDPKNKLVEPVTNWLIKNRRGAQWSNTRDTAIVVLTLNDYLKTSGELSPVLGYELLVNGKSIATKQITADDALSAPSRFAIPRDAIRDGANEITIRRTQGGGPIYFAAEAKFFSLEEPIPAAGNEIFVRRQYFKLVNHPTLLKGFVSQRVALNDGETVKSGERVEVVLTIEAKNNYEYLLFEDLKPAGLEAVAIRSGESLYARELKSGALAGRNAALMNFKSSADFTGRSRWVYQELRDRKVALFIDKLPEGVWQLSYEMRAESPGQFHALPVLGHAMYVPEIRTNGAEVRIRVVD